MFDPSTLTPFPGDEVARKDYPDIHYRLLGTKTHNGYTMGVIVAVLDVNFTTIQTPLLSELVTVELSPLRKLSYMRDCTSAGEISWDGGGMGACAGDACVQGAGTIEGAINALWAEFTKDESDG